MHWTMFKFILFEFLQIMGTDAPDNNSFKYTKTHSHVTFISDDKHKLKHTHTGIQEEGLRSGELFETEGTPFMHAN